MIAQKDPYIKSAYQQLQIISQDKQKRLEYEAREKAIRDHNQMMFEAKQRGIEIGEQRGREQGEYDKSIQIAKNLISLGSNVDFIVKATNLSIEQIQALQDTQN